MKIACFNIQQCIIAYNPHAGKNILSLDKIQYRTDQWKQGSVFILILLSCIWDLPFCIRNYFKHISDLVISCTMLFDVKLVTAFKCFPLNNANHYSIHIIRAIVHYLGKNSGEIVGINNHQTNNRQSIKSSWWRSGRLRVGSEKLHLERHQEGFIDNDFPKIENQRDNI